MYGAVIKLAATFSYYPRSRKLCSCVILTEWLTTSLAGVCMVRTMRGVRALNRDNLKFGFAVR